MLFLRVRHVFAAIDRAYAYYKVTLFAVAYRQAVFYALTANRTGFILIGIYLGYAVWYKTDSNKEFLCFFFVIILE